MAAEIFATTTFGHEQVKDWGEFAADFNPLHTDPKFAAGTQFGRPIVHGHLVTAWALDSIQQIFESRGATAGKAEVRFIAPVPVGAQVQLRLESLDTFEVCSDTGELLVSFAVQPRNSEESA